MYYCQIEIWVYILKKSRHDFQGKVLRNLHDQVQMFLNRAMQTEVT